MVDWLAGNRVRGTSTERTTSTGFNDGFTGVGGWKEVGRTTLGSAGTSINVTGLADKRYYMVLSSPRRAATGNAGYNFDSDTGSNYAFRYSGQGAADSTGVSDTRILSNGNGSSTNTLFHVGYVSNLASKEKLFSFHAAEAAATGAGAVPERIECVGKHAQTSTALSAIGLNSTSNYATGSEVVVLGWDEDDTHTTNFWEELASVELGSAGDTLSSGTISAKKYLWVQCWYENNSASDINVKMRFNNDSATNYASRYSLNGASDTSRTSKTFIDTQASGGQYPNFVNCFIVNNASNEKLVISNSVGQNTAGAGTAPIRTEIVGKWTNTSNQITEIDFDNVDAGDISAGAIMKVWGSD